MNATRFWVQLQLLGVTKDAEAEEDLTIAELGDVASRKGLKAAGNAKNLKNANTSTYTTFCTEMLIGKT